MKVRKILLSAAAATVAVVALGAPASAAPAPAGPGATKPGNAATGVTPFALPQHKCKVDSVSGSVWCLYIEKPNAGQRRYRVHLGIDLHMSRADAQAIIDAPGDPYVGKMRASDEFNDDHLFDVPMVSLTASEGYGLSANFDTVVDGNKLDEDDSIWDGDDEVYGRIIFRDPRTGRTRTFDTPQVHENF